jgi:fatty-acyl-CoA synthase
MLIVFRALLDGRVSMTALVTDGLRWWARNTPDAPAIVFDGTDPVSYRELDRWTDNAARELAEHGVRAGERVGVVGPNSLEWVVGAFAAAKLGAVVAPYNHRFVGAELGHLVASSQPSLVLAGGDNHQRMTEIPGPAEGAGPVDGADPGGWRLLPLEPLARLRHAEHTPMPRVAVGPDEVAVLSYTSGTTSRPKGVIFTHRTVLALISEFGFTQPALRPGLRILFLLSLAGAPGFIWHVLQATTRGATLYLERGFDPKSALARVSGERIGMISGVPVLYDQMAALPEFAGADLSSLELVTVGGARVSRATLAAWLDKGVVIRQIYGMTELGGVSTANPPDKAVSNPELVGRGSMFTPHRVVRADGSDCEPGEPGEIIVSGPSVTPGYWRDRAATEAALIDGWFHTGDVGVFDEDGFLRIVDRIKDLIISGGYNIAPSEIEDVINEMPGVREVAVISVPDTKFGETPGAIVVPGGLAPAEVVAHCAARLADFKVPRYVVPRDEPLPRMASGKIDKRALAEEYSDLSTTATKVR